MHFIKIDGHHPTLSVGSKDYQKQQNRGHDQRQASHGTFHS